MYGLWGLILVGLGVALPWTWLDAEARRGLVIGACVAFPIQWAAFGLLLRFRHRANAFLAVWAGGTLVRMGSVLGAGILLLRVDSADPAALLLALAGFFFGMLLLEPLFLRPGTAESN
jgi:hypothetical protein